MTQVNTSLRTLLRVDEAAQILGVDTRTIKRYASAGRLRPVALTSRTTRYRLDEVEALIDACTVGSFKNDAPADNGRVGKVGDRDAQDKP